MYMKKLKTKFVFLKKNHIHICVSIMNWRLVLNYTNSTICTESYFRKTDRYEWKHLGRNVGNARTPL